MFDFNNNTAGLDNKPIISWQVMFMTPLGICVTLADAVNACKMNDWNPNMVVVPIAVALTETGHEASAIRA